MQVQFFGAASSPTVCFYVLRKAAADNERDFPGLVEKVEMNCYMDNYMDSFDTEAEAVEFREKNSRRTRERWIPLDSMDVHIACCTPLDPE